jgi:hypothetical protein
MHAVPVLVTLDVFEQRLPRLEIRCLSSLMDEFALESVKNAHCRSSCRCAGDRHRPRYQTRAVVETIIRITLSLEAPRSIRTDNKPDFISKTLNRWAYENGITMEFGRPDKPTDNAADESLAAACGANA